MIKERIPTKKDIETTFKVCRLVFSTPLYMVLLLMTIPTFSLLLLLPTDYQLLLDFVLLGDADVQTRLSVLYNILPLTGQTTYSVLTDTLLYLVATTVSVNIVLLIYHLKEHGLAFQNTAGGTVGSVLAVIGAGCVSCGSAIITALFSIVGLSGALTILPLEGGELLVIAISISVLSTVWMSKGLRGGEVRGCPV